MKPNFVVKGLLLSLLAGGVLAASSATSPATLSVKGHAPAATSVTITPEAVNVGDVVTATYTYADVDGDVESGTSFQWVRDGVAITGATGRTYTTKVDDAGKELVVMVVARSTMTADPISGPPTTSNRAKVLDSKALVTVRRMNIAVLKEIKGDGPIADAQCKAALPGTHMAKYEDWVNMARETGDEAGEINKIIESAVQGSGSLLKGRFTALDTGTAPTVSLTDGVVWRIQTIFFPTNGINVVPSNPTVESIADIKYLLVPVCVPDEYRGPVAK